MPEVAASPIEIAKAYMGSRTTDIDNSSRGMISRNERSLLLGAELPSKPFIPPPSPKPSAYWPGAMVQDQRDYFTPQTHRARVGLHNFPRTPYSRTIFSKSKSKVFVLLKLLVLTFTLVIRRALCEIIFLSSILSVNPITS